MKTQQHTPGRWEIGPHQRIISGGWSIRISDGSAIAYVLGEKNPELRANARLIRVAPELLEALEIIAAGNTDPDRMVEIAIAAIALKDAE